MTPKDKAGSEWLEAIVEQVMMAPGPSVAEPTLESVGGLEAWSQEQLGGVELGNARRHARFCSLLMRLAQSPREALPAQCRSSAEVKGAYRAISYPEANAAGLMAGHSAASRARIAAQPPADGVVLAIQDTTTLNFTSHHALSGQGPIGKNIRSETTGFHAHGTMLMSAQGHVFGMLESEFYVREAATRDSKARVASGKRNRQQAKDKESARWLRSLNLSAALAGERGGASITVNVADREADMYELWLLHSELRVSVPQLHLLVRSQHNRKLHGQDTLLREHLGALPAQGQWEIELPAARGMGAQTRQVEAVWDQVLLAVPGHQQKYQGYSQPQSLWVIEVREPKPPRGAQALHWIILSTWPITEECSARQALGWYAQRWQIEVLHRIWKSGCRVEQRRVQEPRAMQCLMMLDLMVAVQLLSLVKAARLTPQAPASLLLGEAEVSCLKAYAAKHEASTTAGPKAGAGAQAQPMTLGQVMASIARLGGYQGNPQKRPPGAEVLWRGIQRLHDLTQGWLLAQHQESG